MTNYSLPYFGQINLAELEGYYNTEVELQGHTVKLDLNFEKKIINENQIEIVNNFLENIDKFDSQNKSFIFDDFEKQGETSDYINFYLEEFDEDEISRIVDDRIEKVTPEMQLLRKLKLVRVGLYPDGKYGAVYFGVFDYSIDIDFETSNQLLVIKTNENGNLEHITWES